MNASVKSGVSDNLDKLVIFPFTEDVTTFPFGSKMQSISSMMSKNISSLVYLTEDTRHGVLLRRLSGRAFAVLLDLPVMVMMCNGDDV